VVQVFPPPGSLAYMKLKLPEGQLQSLLLLVPARGSSPGSEFLQVHAHEIGDGRMTLDRDFVKLFD
jgi:hypothetical protein